MKKKVQSEKMHKKRTTVVKSKLPEQHQQHLHQPSSLPAGEAQHAVETNKVAFEIVEQKICDLRRDFDQKLAELKENRAEDLAKIEQALKVVNDTIEELSRRVQALELERTHWKELLRNVLHS